MLGVWSLNLCYKGTLEPREESCLPMSHSCPWYSHMDWGQETLSDDLYSLCLFYPVVLGLNLGLLVCKESALPMKCPSPYPDP